LCSFVDTDLTAVAGLVAGALLAGVGRTGLSCLIDLAFALFKALLKISALVALISFSTAGYSAGVASIFSSFLTFIYFVDSVYCCEFSPSLASFSRNTCLSL